MVITRFTEQDRERERGEIVVFIHIATFFRLKNVFVFLIAFSVMSSAWTKVVALTI